MPSTFLKTSITRVRINSLLLPRAAARMINSPSKSRIRMRTKRWCQENNITREKKQKRPLIRSLVIEYERADSLLCEEELSYYKAAKAN